MPFSQIPNVRLSAVTATVPATVRRYLEEARALGENLPQVERIAKSVGFSERRIASENQTALDLCVHSAEQLLSSPDFSSLRDKVDGLIFVTQSPDHFQPCNAAVAHGKLRLREDCATFDINLGCSGYVYGLWLAHQLLTGGGCENVLLLAGDTLSKAVRPDDRAVAPLFGDAGSASLLQRCPDSPNSGFLLKSDGSGSDTICIPSGAYRSSASADSPAFLRMDGAEVFNFSLRVAAPATQELLEKMAVPVDLVDAFFFHQANRFIVQSIARKLKLTESTAPSDSFSKYGNTSSASIPLALCHDRQFNPTRPLRRVVFCGFGVGLSWGACHLTVSDSLRCSLLDLAASS